MYLLEKGPVKGLSTFTLEDESDMKEDEKSPANGRIRTQDLK